MIRWTDMVDPVYTLARLADVDPDAVEIVGITILQHRLIIYYKTINGVNGHVSKEFSL